MADDPLPVENPCHEFEMAVAASQADVAALVASLGEALTLLDQRLMDLDDCLNQQSMMNAADPLAIAGQLMDVSHGEVRRAIKRALRKK